MNSFKRLFVSLKSQIDQVADEFENHEALADAAINDLQDIARKTRLQLHRLNKLSNDYQQQIEHRQQQALLWSERAIKARRDDEDKALQCVKRLRQCQQQIKLLEKQLLTSSEQESKLQTDLNTIQEQLLTMNNKKALLAARQTRNHSRQTLQAQSSNPLQDAEQIFARWEETVIGDEWLEPETLPIDNLAAGFEAEEDELALKMMLDELTQPTTEH